MMVAVDATGITSRKTTSIQPKCVVGMLLALLERVWLARHTLVTCDTSTVSISTGPLHLHQLESASQIDNVGDVMR